MSDHIMRIMDPDEGDEVVTWDPDNEKSVKTAQEKFDKALKKGMSAFPVKSKKVADDKAGPLKTFDPSIREMVLTPAMAGG